MTEVGEAPAPPPAPAPVLRSTPHFLLISWPSKAVVNETKDWAVSIENTTHYTGGVGVYGKLRVVAVELPAEGVEKYRLWPGHEVQFQIPYSDPMIGYGTTSVSGRIQFLVKGTFKFKLELYNEAGERTEVSDVLGDASLDVAAAARLRARR